MPFQKDLVNSNGVKVSVAEAAGELKLSLEIGVDAGGGNVAGFAKVKGLIEADLDGQVLIDAGFDLVAAKFSNPLILAAVKELKALVDAELPKA